MKHKFAGRQNQQGSMIAIALIGLVIVSLVISYFMTSYATANKSRARANFFNAISEIQLNVRNAVNSDPAWLATIGDSAHNSSMICLASGSCGTVTNVPFALWPPGITDYSDTANAIYNSTDPAAGFKLTGEKCTGFAATGNANCPLRVNLTWSTCSGCAVTVNLDLQYAPGETSPIGAINTDNYKLAITQKLLGATDICAGDPPLFEAVKCAMPPYPNDKLYCTPVGWKCGQVFF